MPCGTRLAFPRRWRRFSPPAGWRATSRSWRRSWPSTARPRSTTSSPRTTASPSRMTGSKTWNAPTESSSDPAARCRPSAAVNGRRLPGRGVAKDGRGQWRVAVWPEEAAGRRTILLQILKLVHNGGRRAFSLTYGVTHRDIVHGRRPGLTTGLFRDITRTRDVGHLDRVEAVGQEHPGRRVRDQVASEALLALPDPLRRGSRTPVRDIASILRVAHSEKGAQALG